MAPQKLAKRPKAESEKSPVLDLEAVPGEIIDESDLNYEYWYDNAPAWPENGKGGLRASIDRWRELAGQALSEMSVKFDNETNRPKAKSQSIQKLMEREKTMRDKIDCAVLFIAQSPLHRLDELHTLFSFVQRKGRHERSLAMDSFKDLMISNLLPDGRRLLKFEEREFNCGIKKITKRHLSYALFEDELKSLVSQFLEVLEECAKDTVIHFKVKSVSVVYELLANKPEREKDLLMMLVNKLGDPEQKVASDTAYKLGLLVKQHPQMKSLLVGEVEQLLFRKNVGLRTQYCSIGFLNQLQLMKSDVQLARRLVTLYMSLVSSFASAERDRKKDKETGVCVQENKIMGAILAGVTRAFPYTDPESFDLSLGSNLDALFRIAHAQSITSSTRALAFLLQISRTSDTISDRFYRALYSRIHDLASAGESKQALLLNVIFSGMKADVSAKRVKAFVKRLLQTALKANSAVCSAILMLLSELLSSRHPGMLKASVTSGVEDTEEKFVDVDSDAEERAAPKDDAQEAPEDQFKNNFDIYDISAREPLYARAERSAVWELVALSSHFHPSTRKFAKDLCEAENLTSYPSDPLTDFTLSAFLDKFCYKAPKRKLTNSLHGKRAARAAESLVLKNNKFFDRVRKGEEDDDDAFFGKFFHMNPEKLDILEGVPNASNGCSADDGNHSESEEEAAFEEEMHAEMQRLGAEVPGVSGSDIDEDNPDELAAFADAFKDEIDAFGEDEGFLPKLAEDEGKPKMQESVFAAQEDYAEQIEEFEKQMRDVADEETTADEDVQATKGKKRRTTQKKGRNRKRKKH